jgi:phosphatidylglycerol---prolipoprotein diacylglyceryl transferase
VIPSYLFVISMVFCIGIVWISRRARSRALDYKLSLDLSLAFMAGSLIGARLLHVIYERPDIYLTDPMRIFEVWRGGFVFYGGAMTAALFCFVLLKIRREPFLPWADLFAPVLAFGYALGRIGCFLEGCCYGRQCDLPWAVHGLHPTQLYATFWEFAVLGFLLWLERRPGLHRKGFVFFVWMALHGLGRLLMEHFRDDFRGPEAMGLSISTVLSLIIVAIGLAGCYKTREAN